MPKLIDYPRTSYAGAWELAEVVDDTGGKCEIETAARKLNRKVSGSFKAIIGSAVKFGLLTSKRELLSTTTLFKRIKHAYDKKEELLFHREAFLTPPLFSQICRKFRLRELPVQMLDVMLIREFGVEEINAQGVAKAFVDGCRMVNLLDERNTMADIDANSLQSQPRRELASPVLAQKQFTPNPVTPADFTEHVASSPNPATDGPRATEVTTGSRTASRPADAVASLFGLFQGEDQPDQPQTDASTAPQPSIATAAAPFEPNTAEPAPAPNEPLLRPQATATHLPLAPQPLAYSIQISGPGLNSTLSILEEDDLLIAQALLEKIRRQLKSKDQ